MEQQITISPVSECALLIRFSNSEPNGSLPSIIGAATEQLYNQLNHYIMNITPSVDSILVDYLPHRIGFKTLTSRIEQCIISIDENSLTSSQTHPLELPVYYHLDVGPDIKQYENKGITLAQLIEIHSQPIYTVVAIGFAPGFAFMKDVDTQLQLPRLSTPRLNVPKGSVAIAENYTAIYPNASPGGWNIIGNCPIELYQTGREPMIPFKIGSKIKFTPIDRDTFFSLGGTIEGEFS